MPASGGGDAAHFARPTPPKAYAYGYAYIPIVTIVVAALLHSSFKLSCEKLECRMVQTLTQFFHPARISD